MTASEWQTLTWLLFLPYATFVGIAALLVPALRRTLPSEYRLWVFIVYCTLFLTPSFGGATIVVIPAPLGTLWVLGARDGFLFDVARGVLFFWQWHMVAIPVTSGLAYLVGRRLFPRAEVSAK